jgi:Uma2 family endonuclease
MNPLDEGQETGGGDEESHGQDARPPVLPPEEIPVPDLDHIVIQDDQPVDSIFVEKQQRLLTEPLETSWEGPGEDRTFLVLANVGVFSTDKDPPLVPDVLLSTDVPVGTDLKKKKNRSYFIWVMGKPPDVAVEIVSDRRGGELTHKMREYARIRVLYYVIFDPDRHLRGEVLRVFRLVDGAYEPIDPLWLPAVGLGLTLWQGTYAGYDGQWLRWCDQKGRVIPAGRERAEQERQRAEQERQRAKQERQRTKLARQRAEQERQRREQLEAKLRELGIDPSA